MSREDRNRVDWPLKLSNSYLKLSQWLAKCIFKAYNPDPDSEGIPQVDSYFFICVFHLTTLSRTSRVQTALSARVEAVQCSACVHDTIYWTLDAEKVTLFQRPRQFWDNCESICHLHPWVLLHLNSQVNLTAELWFESMRARTEKDVPWIKSWPQTVFWEGDGENRTGMATDGRGRFLKRGGPISYALLVSWKLSLFWLS